MEKLYQVFVSSTYEDLVDAREEVVQILLESDCMPAGMELFPASNEDRWSLIKRVIDNCDYYLVIIAGRYGSITPEGLSYTEREYDYAVQRGTPAAAFIHARPDEIAGKYLDRDNDNVARLDAFRNKVKERAVCKFWTSPQELAGQVAISINHLKTRFPAEGWVRAGQVASPEMLRESAELRQTVAQLRLELERQGGIQVVDVALLEQGDDVVVFAFAMRYRDRSMTSKVARLSSATTWDALFRDVGPLMLHECSESAFVQQFEVHIRSRVPQEARPADVDRYVSLQTLGTNDFQLVKVQFLALGLIVASERRRAVHDTNAYWTLSDRGRALLIALSAVRRRVVTDVVEQVE